MQPSRTQTPAAPSSPSSPSGPQQPPAAPRGPNGPSGPQGPQRPPAAPAAPRGPNGPQRPQRPPGAPLDFQTAGLMLNPVSREAAGGAPHACRPSALLLLTPSGASGTCWLSKPQETQATVEGGRLEGWNPSWPRQGAAACRSPRCKKLQLSKDLPRIPPMKKTNTESTR